MLSPHLPLHAVGVSSGELCMVSKVDIRKEIERMAPCLDHARGCALVVYAVLLGSLVTALKAMFVGDFDWRTAPFDLLAFIGIYWVVTTVAYAAFRKK